MCDLAKCKAGKKIHTSASKPIPYFDREVAMGEPINTKTRRVVSGRMRVIKPLGVPISKSGLQRDVKMYSHQLSNSHWFMHRGNDPILVSGNGS